jgi:hypothetical protein
MNMAFESRNFRKLQRVGINTWWQYSTLQDTAKTVGGRGYFSEAQDRFAVGDWIFCSGNDKGCVLHVNDIDPLEMNAT